VAYRVEVAPHAERQLRRLPKSIQMRLTTRMKALADEPRPPGVEKLAGEENLYRIRVGDYRIIYAIEDEVLLVLVVTVGHRREVYRHPT
jgi:mRNA interferase RelE/StbE